MDTLTYYLEIAPMEYQDDSVHTHIKFIQYNNQINEI